MSDLPADILDDIRGELVDIYHLLREIRDRLPARPGIPTPASLAAFTPAPRDPPPVIACSGVCSEHGEFVNEQAMGCPQCNARLKS